MTVLKGVNLTLSFLMELVAVAVFGVWGFQITENGLLRVILGLGAPLLMIVVWGLWMAPRSTRRLQDPAHLVVELVIFGLAVLALFSLNRADLALVMAAAAVINIGLTFPLHQRPSAAA